MISSDPQIEDFISDHETEQISKLALKIKSFSESERKYILRQVAGKQIAKHKIPLWYKHSGIIYPQHLSLEQASSERTANYKAGLCGEIETLVDLTGGLGIDFSFMSQTAKKAVYVEKQSELVNLAKHNFKVFDLDNVSVINEDATDYIKELDDNSVDLIFIDPARRDENGKKTFFIKDCTPDLTIIDQQLDKIAKRTIIKLSPMLDISHAVRSLNNINQIHIVSVNNEVKELLLIKGKHLEAPLYYCINLLPEGQQEIYTFSIDQEDVAEPNYTEKAYRYLYEPNNSIMKGGAYKSIAISYGLYKLHPNSHLYTSDEFIADFPGRKFIVQQVLSPSKKEVKQLQEKIKQANISTRNYPFSVGEIRKQIKLKDGGSKYIFATTLFNEKKVLILCTKADIQS